MIRAILLVSVVVLSGCNKTANVQESRSEPGNSDEKLVRNFILLTATTQGVKGERVEFVSWGPHDLANETGVKDYFIAASKQSGGSLSHEGLDIGKPFKIIRTVYRMPAQVTVVEKAAPVDPNAAKQTGPITIQPDKLDQWKTVEKITTSDALWLVNGEKVIPLGDNKDGSNWKLAMKKKFGAFK